MIFNMWYISHLIFAFTVIHKPWLLSTFENVDVSRRKKWKLVSFATARRNKTDLIEIELLRYIPPDVQWKGQISPVMQIWCAFELKLTSGYKHRYFLQILLQLALTLSFNMSFIYYYNYHRRIQCAKDQERFDLPPHRSHNIEYILRLTVCKFKFSAMHMHCELKIISGKNLLFYSNSLSNIITFAF